MTQAICDITTDEVNVDVVVEPQADTMVEVANRAGGMEQVFHDNTLIGNGNSIDLGVNTDLIATKEYVDEKVESIDTYTKDQIDGKLTAVNADLATKATKTELANAKTVLEESIQGNADAILKTRNDFTAADQAIRDDMNAEDGRLQSQITAHASAITTNKNDIDELGDQVAEIESKIPESASATNQLATKADLEDVHVDLTGYATTEYVNAREQEIRDDVNQADSELQSQITAQATAIAGKQDQLTAGNNITIVDNVISATGAGGGTGFDVQVVQELPATGQKGIIYLLAKDGTAPDVYDEYVWITATQTFELIGTTQVDLTDYATKEELGGYLPTTGGTMTGTLNINREGSFLSSGKFLSFTSQTSTGGDKYTFSFYTVYGSQALFLSGGNFYPFGDNQTLGSNASNNYRWKSVATRQIYNGGAIDVPTKGGTMALLEDITDINNNSINTKDLTVGTDEGTLSLSITAGTATIATNNGLDIAAQTKFDTAPTTDDTTAWADVNPTALVTKQQVATAVSESGGTDLPDQTGNAGKFLTTDGATASWSDKPLVNTATNINSVGIGRFAGAGRLYTVNIGGNSACNANYAVALGYSAQTNNDSPYAIAIGYEASTNATHAIQLGTTGSGWTTNSDANTFKVGNANGNFEMMSADGTIPADRMSATAGTTGQVLTKTDTGMAWQDASGGDGDIDCGVMS